MEAMGYADFTAKVFLDKYGPFVDMSIIAMWQRLSLAYKLKDLKTEEYAI